MARFVPPTRWRLRNRILFLLGLLFVALGGPYLMPLWEMSDFDPRLTIYIGVIGIWSSMLAWVLLAVWLFFFSIFPFKLRMALLALAVAYVALIDDIQLDSYRRPILHHRWQSHPTDELAKFLDEQPPEPDSGLDLTVDPVNDFPRFRGLRGDGIAVPTALFDLKWADDKPPREKWRHPCGGGFAGFAVAGNGAVTLEQREADEAVVCYDRATGVQRWAYAYPASFRDISGHGPRATPTVADGRVYSHGATGQVVCVDGKTGKPIWSRNCLDDAKAKRVAWGMTSSPLVVDGLVIVNAGIDAKANAGKAVLAYRASDGEIAWASGTHPAAYSSALVATLAGRRQIVLFDDAGLGGYALEDGAELWRFPWPSLTDGNVSQPLVLERDRVFIASETGKGCAMLRVKRKGDGFEAEELWANNNLCSRYSNPIRMGNAIYGLSSGYLVCLDIETGKRHWRSRHCYRNGQLLGVAGTVLVQDEGGEIVSVAADPKKQTILARFRAFDARTWNTPALAGRCLYLRTQTEMACYELPLRE